MKKEFKVEGMTCQHCVMAIQRNLQKLNLKKFAVSIGSVKIDFDLEEITEAAIIEAIEEAGYKVTR